MHHVYFESLHHYQHIRAAHHHRLILLICSYNHGFAVSIHKLARRGHGDVRMAEAEIEQLVKRYNLVAHPEGGYFSQWYASELALSKDLDSRWEAGSTRSAGTAIHYLCPAGQRSALHSILADELWFWHAGGPLVVVELQSPATPGADAVVKQTVLGPVGAAAGGERAEQAATCTHVVRGGTLFGAYCPPGSAYALVSCVVAPGFDYRDWAMPTAEEMRAAYPGAAAATAIGRLAKDAAAS